MRGSPPSSANIPGAVRDIVLTSDVEWVDKGYKEKGPKLVGTREDLYLYILDQGILLWQPLEAQLLPQWQDKSATQKQIRTVELRNHSCRRRV